MTVKMCLYRRQQDSVYQDDDAPMKPSLNEHGDGAVSVPEDCAPPGNSALQLDEKEDEERRKFEMESAFSELPSDEDKEAVSVSIHPLMSVRIHPLMIHFSF